MRSFTNITRTEGQGDLIRIDLPKGTYKPEIEFLHTVIRHWPPGRQREEGSSVVPSLAVLSFDDLSAG